MASASKLGCLGLECKSCLLTSDFDFPRLRSASVMVRFVTNTTKESKQDLLDRLKKLEFDISEDEIFTSLTAARNLVEQKQVRPMLLVDDRALPDFKGRGHLERYRNWFFMFAYNHS